MTTAGQGDGAGQDPQAPVTDPDKVVPRWSPRKIFARKKRVKAPRHHRSGLLGRLVFLALVFGLGALTLQLMGRTLPMPVWVVAEVEARLNSSLADALPGGALSLGGIDVTVGEDWVPHLVLEDLRLLQADGQTLLALPETYFSLDPAGLPQGQFRAKSLRIVGAHVDLRRDQQGNLQPEFNLNGLGVALQNVDIPPLGGLTGGLFVGNLNDPANLYFAGTVGGTVNDVGAEVTLALHRQKGWRFSLIG